MGANYDDASIQGRYDAVDDEVSSVALVDATLVLAMEANDETTPSPPRDAATNASAAIRLNDDISTAATISSSSHDSYNSNSTTADAADAAAAGEDALSTRPPSHRHFVRLRSFSLHLPDGDLVDCKNTVQSHSLLNYSRDEDNDSSLLLATATLPSSSIDSLILPVDLEKSVTVPTDHSDDNGNPAAAVSSNGHDTTTFRTLECPVAIPVETIVATDVMPPPRIHYLMMEPVEVEQDRLLTGQRQNVNAHPTTLTARLWTTPWFRKRLVGLSLTAILSLLVLWMVRKNTPNDDSSRRAAAITKLINDVSLSKTNVTLIDSYFGSEPLSVEQRALRWLVYDDPQQLTFNDDNSVTKFRLVQRYALVILFMHLPPDHPNLLKLESHECNWSGISCTNVTLRGSKTDATPAVVKVKLQSSVGKISSDLGLLSHLKHLDLSRCGIRGALPSSIGAWTALKYFNVASNYLNGSLPDSIAKWTNLEYFNLATNQGLTGSMPDSTRRWTALKFFDVSHNQFTGTLPIARGQWMMLEYFVVRGNIYRDSLPELLGQWTNLVAFDVSMNWITGTLPPIIGQWTNLTYFGVRETDLVGTIPESILSWTNIQLAYFTRTNLTGTIPMGLCSTSLWEIGVNCNNVDCLCGKDLCSCRNSSFILPMWDSRNDDEISVVKTTRYNGGS